MSTPLQIVNNAAQTARRVALADFTSGEGPIYLSALNLAINEILTANGGSWPFLLMFDTKSSVIGQAYLDAPTNYKLDKLVGILDTVSGFPLTRTEWKLEALDGVLQTVSGNPIEYFEADKIYLRPVPADIRAYSVFFYKKFTALTDADKNNELAIIPVEFHHVIEAHLFAFSLKFERQLAEYTAARADFVNLLSGMIEYYATKPDQWLRLNAGGRPGFGRLQLPSNFPTR